MYLPISTYHHLGWYWPPIWNLDIFPWIGFSLGYAISTPVMAKMNRSCWACTRKTKIEWCPRVTQFVTFSSLISVSLVMLATMLLLSSHGNTTPGQDSFHPLPQICKYAKPRFLRLAFVFNHFYHSLIFPLNLQFLSHFYNQGFKLSFLAPFWWLQFILIRNWQ